MENQGFHWTPSPAKCTVPAMSRAEEDTRPYRQVARARAAEETRRSIVQAAREHLLAKGYQAMRMEEVAATAGTARASVFRHFPHKADLLRAVEVDAAERAGVAELITRLPRLSPLEALTTAIHEGSRIWAAEARIFQEFYGTAPFDEVLRPLVAEKEAQRRQVVGELITRLEQAGLLRTGTANASQVADALWLLTGFDSFDALTRVRGLSTHAAAELIETTVFNAFIAQRHHG